MIRPVLLALGVIGLLTTNVAWAQGEKDKNVVKIPAPQWKKGERFKMTARQSLVRAKYNFDGYKNSMVRQWVVQVGEKEGSENRLHVVLLKTSSDLKIGQGKNLYRLKKKEFKGVMNLLEGAKAGIPMVLAYTPSAFRWRVANPDEIKAALVKKRAPLVARGVENPMIPKGFERQFATVAELELKDEDAVATDPINALKMLLRFNKSAMDKTKQYQGIAAVVPFLPGGVNAKIEKHSNSPKQVTIRSWEIKQPNETKGMGIEVTDLVNELRSEFPSGKFDFIIRTDWQHSYDWGKGIPLGVQEIGTLNVYAKDAAKTAMGSVTFRDVTYKLERY